MPPARVATTGRAAASASIATTGVPSFADVSRRASKDAYQGRMLFWKPTSRQRSATPSSARERLHVGAVLAVADEHEQRVHVRVEERAQRPDQVERPLDRREPAGPADDEGLVAGSDLPAELPA